MTTNARLPRPVMTLAVAALLLAGCAAQPGSTWLTPAISAPPSDPAPSPATQEPASPPPASGGTPTAGDPVCDRPAVEEPRDFAEGAPAPDPDSAATLATAVGFGGRLLVAGVTDAAGTVRAAAWDATDPAAWRQVDSAAFEASSIADLAVLGDVVVGVGRQWSGADPADPAGDAAAWLSGDGVTWERVESPALVLDDPYGGATLVEAGGPGLVAAGAEGMGEIPRTVVWLSPNGRTWERVADQPAFASSTPASLLARSDGTLVLTLVTCGASGCFEGATLTSPDGRQWTRHAVPAGSPAPTIHQLVDWEGSVLGAGTWYDTDPATGQSRGTTGGVWRWSDGGWALLSGGPRDSGSEGTGEYLGGDTLVAAGDELVATAHHGGSCGPGRTVAWVSPDGVTWKRAWVSPDGDGLETAVDAGNAVILLGSRTDPGSGAAAPVAWVHAR